MDKLALLKSVLKSGGTYREGKVYFIDVPVDAPALQSRSNESIARDQARWTVFRKRNAEFLKNTLGKLSKNLRLIDLGTGPNQFKQITDTFSESIHVDFAPYQDIEIITDLSKELPLLDEVCDIVLATNFLEHTPNPIFSIQESFRILRPNGQYIGIVPFLVGVHQRPYDFFRYTDIQLTNMLTEAGFNEVEVIPLGNIKDTYTQITRQFFQQVIGASKTILPKIIWRILWKMQCMLSFLYTRNPMMK